MKQVAKSVLRRVVYYSLYIFRKEYQYQSDIPGYAGWVEVPTFGLVAFTKSSGALQFKW